LRWTNFPLMLIQKVGPENTLLSVPSQIAFSPIRAGACA
jgi:hypothetical protein